MKYLIVLALCATAAFAELHLDRNTMLKAESDCIAENNLNAAELEDDTKLFPFKNTCFYACFDKKIGMMKQDGTYDIEAMLAQAKTPQRKEDGNKIIMNMMTTCNAQAGSDPCKVAFCVHTMIHTMTSTV